MDRPALLLSSPPAVELKLISHTCDLRLHDGGRPWSFIQPGGRCLTTLRGICLALMLLFCCSIGLIVLFSVQMASITPLLQGLPAAGCIAVLFAGFAWHFRVALRDRRDGELAAAAIRKEMARAPANDRLFALVYRDVGYLELLAFFQEGNGAQRLETIHAPRTGDGSKYTETDIRVIRKVLEKHFSVAQINALNVISFRGHDPAIEAGSRSRHRA